MKRAGTGGDSNPYIAEVRNMITRRSILTIEEIVFVNLNSEGKPEPHGYKQITYARDRFPRTTSLQRRTNFAAGYCTRVQ